MKLTYHDIRNMLRFYLLKIASHSKDAVAQNNMHMQRLQRYYDEELSGSGNNLKMSPEKIDMFNSHSGRGNYTLCIEQIYRLVEIIGAGYSATSAATRADAHDYAAHKIFRSLMTMVDRHTHGDGLELTNAFEHQSYLEYSDIKAILAFYTADRSLMQRLLGDDDDIEQLKNFFNALPRPVQPHNDYKLNADQLNELYYIIANADPDNPGFNTFHMLGCISAYDYYFLESIKCQLCTSFTKEYLIFILNNKNPLDLVKRMLKLSKMGVLTPRNSELIKSHANPNDAARALEELRDHRLATPDHFETVCTHPFPYSLTILLCKLSNKNQLNDNVTRMAGNFLNENDKLSCFNFFYSQMSCTLASLQAFITYYDFFNVIKSDVFFRDTPNLYLPDLFSQLVAVISAISSREAVIKQWQQDNPDKHLPAFTADEIHTLAVSQWKKIARNAVETVVLNAARATDSGQEQMIKINFRKTLENAAIEDAARTGDIELTRTLLSRIKTIHRGNSIRRQELVLQNAVFAAALNGHTNLALMLVKNGAQLVPAVIGSVQGCHVELINALIDARDDILTNNQLSSLYIKIKEANIDFSDWCYQKALMFVASLENKMLREYLAKVIAQKARLMLTPDAFMRLANKHNETMHRYNINIEQTGSLLIPGAKEWLLQGSQLIQDHRLPLEIYGKISEFFTGLSIRNANTVLKAINDKLFQASKEILITNSRLGLFNEKAYTNKLNKASQRHARFKDGFSARPPHL